MRVDDANGLLASITDANQNVTSYTYDSMRRLSTTIFPDGRTESYAYYGDALLQAKTDRNGVTTTYQYDNIGRVASRSNPSISTTYGYQGQNLTFVSDTQGGVTETHQYDYDPNSLLVTTETQGGSYNAATGTNSYRAKITYLWNANSQQLVRYSVKDGDANRAEIAADYTYNADGSVQSIAWSPIAGGTFNFAYNLNGQSKTITFPNGQTRNFEYDNQGRLTKIANLFGITNLATFSYEYDFDNETYLHDARPADENDRRRPGDLGHADRDDVLVRCELPVDESARRNLRLGLDV